jgi:hypothetical protein
MLGMTEEIGREPIGEREAIGEIEEAERRVEERIIDETIGRTVTRLGGKIALIERKEIDIKEEKETM